MVDLAARFHRSGLLVFGRGHVVLPVLQKEVVPLGFISNDAFVAGYKGLVGDPNSVKA